MNRLKAWFTSEKEKIKDLSDWHARAEYIWQYYKLWIIGIVCGLGFIGMVVYNFTTSLAENWIYVLFANTYAEIGTSSEFWDGFVDYSGYDVSQKNVIFNNSSYFDYSKNQGRGNTYYEVFVAYTDSGTLDAVTMEEASLVALGASGRLMDLNREECASIVEKYGDRLVYCEPFDSDYSTDLVPVGIDISDSRLMTEYHLYADSCVLGIGAQSQHIDAVETFLDYIFEEAE